MLIKSSKGLYKVEKNYREAFNLEMFQDKYIEECFDKYQYIVGDFSSNILRLKGFDDNDTLLTGIESRSSSPVRINRGDDLQSVSLKGLYPCGEGAGYAGGIVSAAVDGMKCAEAVIEALSR